MSTIIVSLVLLHCCVVVNLTVFSYFFYSENRLLSCHLHVHQTHALQPTNCKIQSNALRKKDLFTKYSPSSSACDSSHYHLCKGIFYKKTQFFNALFNTHNLFANLDISIKKY